MPYCAAKIRGFSQVLLILLALGALSQVEAATSMYSFNAPNAYGNSYVTPQSFGNVFTPVKDIMIDSLGIFDYGGDGLGESHAVGIFENSGTLLASTVVPAGTVSPLDNHFRYTDIVPIQLKAGQTYTVVTFFNTHADMVGYADVEDLVVSSDISLPGFAARFVFQRGLGLQFPANWRNASSEFYIGPNFRFTPVPTFTSSLTPSSPALGPVPVTHTPLPGSVWLLASGLLGLFALKRKYRS